MCGTDSQANSMTIDAMADKMVDLHLKGKTVKACAKKENCENGGNCRMAMATAVMERKLIERQLGQNSSLMNPQYAHNVFQFEFKKGPLQFVPAQSA